MIPMAVAADLRGRLEAFVRAAKRVRSREQAYAEGGLDPDPEAVHDLRVASRRLGVGLSLWRPVLRGRRSRKAARRLRRVRRAYGEVRNLEVHDEALARLRETAPDAADAIDAARAALPARDSLMRAARRRLAPKRIRRLVRDVTSALAPLADEPPRLEDVREAAARLSSHRRTARSAIAAALIADDRDPEPFHRARIATKKWRYAEERWHAAHGSESRIASRLRDVQNSLGRAHDRSTLRAALASVPGIAAIRERLGREEREALSRFREQAQPLAARPRHHAGGAA